MKTTTLTTLKPLALAISLSLLSACGGGGGSDSSGSGDGGIIGTATIPKVTSLSPVEAKSKSGKRQTATIAADGAFKLDHLDAQTYLLRVKPKNSARNAARSSETQYLYSIGRVDAASNIKRNIHPFTDLIVRNWFATRGLDIDTEFNKSAGFSQLPSVSEINAIESEIEGVIARVLKDYGVGSGANNSVDLFSTPFTRNGQGFDKFLNRNPVIINNNQVTLIFNQPNGDTQSISINGLPLNTDFTSNNDTPPTTPSKLRALPASTSEIVVVWQASTDDKGVAGYNVYRNGALVGTSPFPVFSDTGLSTNTNYSYEVEAIDSRGQKSSRTSPSTPLVLNTPDTTPPVAATGLSATAFGNDIKLNWTQAQIDDVSSFRILRGAPGNANTEIAQITSTAFTDFNLPASSTAYCYRIISTDAAGNQSPKSNESCANVGSGGGGSSQISFSSSSYQVNENAGSISITVNRTGDIGQPVTVHYATSAVSATSGSDFTAASGTLNWAANDTSPKTITIQIANDNIAEGSETLKLILSNSSGASIETSTATLTIKDTAVAQCVDLQDTDITQDTTLSLPCYKVNNGITVTNPAKLTVSPGVKLMFASGRKLEVGEGASLYAVGTASNPIVFTGLENTPGFWDGILYRYSNSSNNQLNHVIVEYGVKNIDTVSFPQSPVRLSIKNTTSRHASNVGVYIYNRSVKLDAFGNNTLTLNDRPITLPSNMVGILGSDSTFSGNTDDRLHVYDDGDITTEQTWDKLDIPYYLRSSSSYEIKAGLTLKAGTTLIFNSGAKFEAGEGGSLNAIGTATSPIIFTGQEQTAGYWDGLSFRYSNSTKNKLDHVIVEYGVKNIDTISFPQSPVRLSIKNSVLRHASDTGFYIYGASVKLDAFEKNTISSNELPLYLPSELVGKLDKSSTYSGNSDDRIYVFDSDLDTTQTWNKLDVPYFLRSSSLYNIDAGLTIEAGTTLYFNSGAGLEVGESGSLKAIGSASAPVTFTGQEKSQGYWKGLMFRYSNSTNNKLDHTIIEYAGSGNPNNSGNISSVCFPQSPTRFSISNSIIRESISWGVYKYGNVSDGCFITLSGNTYSNNLSGDVNNP